MKLYVINGPSINMLGIREPDIYGKETYGSLLDKIANWAKENNVEVTCLQSNVEGEIVNYIQKAYFEKIDGIVINPAAYTHTSVAILDALKACNIPAIEVHISDIDKREDFRKISLTSKFCYKVIKGLGVNGYLVALDDIKKHLEENLWLVKVIQLLK